MKKRHLTLGLLILFLAIPFILLLGDFARDVIAVQITRLYWALGLLFDSMPQFLVWGLFLVVALAAALQSLVGGRWPTRRPRSIPTEEAVGPVRRISHQVQRAEEGVYFQWGLCQYLSRLTLEVLADRTGSSLAELRSQLRDGDLEVPPDVLAYLQQGLRPAFTKPPGVLAWLLRRKSIPPQPDLEAVLLFLETELEN